MNLSSRTRTVLYHILFWVVYTAIFTITDGGYSNRFDRAFLVEMSHLPLRLVVVYTHFFILFPRLFMKGRYVQYISITLAMLIAAAFLQRAILFYYVSPPLYPTSTDVTTYLIPYKILQAGVILATPMLFLLSFSMLHRVFTLREKTETLEREKLQSELRFLRSQLNPHFFFNTLNSLYGLTQERSENAPGVVLKLSELMNFVLYETDKESISLSQELKYVKNYIELEEIRFGDRFTCNLSIEGNTDVPISPLLTLPFVENSFKHGIRDESEKGWININVRVMEGVFTFKMENSIPRVRREEDHKPGGLGISNVLRRLNLLYPGRHKIDYGRDGDTYKVYLEIQLAKK